MNPGANRLRTPFADLKRRQFTAHDRLHPLIRLYLLGLVRARLGDTAARRYAGELVGVELPRTAGSLAEDLARSVRARILREGRAAAALAELDGARMETWYGQTMASPLYSQVFERFVRAELLYQLGRLEELWRDADPPLQPRVDAARARLADLRAGEEADRSP